MLLGFVCCGAFFLCLAVVWGLWFGCAFFGVEPLCRTALRVSGVVALGVVEMGVF